MRTFGWVLVLDVQIERLVLPDVPGQEGIQLCERLDHAQRQQVTGRGLRGRGGGGDGRFPDHRVEAVFDGVGRQATASSGSHRFLCRCEVGMQGQMYLFPCISQKEASPLA